MLEKLEEMDIRCQQLEELIQKPETVKNPTLYSEYRKEHGHLNRVVSVYRQLKKVRQDIQHAEQLAKEDQELKELAEEELLELKKREIETVEAIQELLITDDEDPNKNIIVEIRAGTGGEEAALFARDLFEMYCKFAEKKRWKVEIMDSSPSDLKGYKEITFGIKGKNVYGLMKHESGGHRVQRIPVTESNGRIHTSACTIAVLPEAEEVDMEVKQEDLEIELFKRSSGPGGQNVNKTNSAVRIIHKPTGIMVECKATPEQHKNKMEAMRLLRAKLYQKTQEEQHAQRNEIRRSQNLTGDRSDRIRTYNFPQNRITDHRINFSIYNLAVFMEGNLEEMMDQMRQYERQKRMEALQGGGKN